MSSQRLVAVLGYSRRRGTELHPVCAARLARAAAEATPADAVLLSGWSRRGGCSSEAELMAQAWNGSATRVLLDPGAGSTYRNAVGVARAARELGTEDVVLVTSGWHRRRASRLVRAALRGTAGTVKVVATADRGSLLHRCRELLCWTIVPLQVALLAARR